MQKSTAALDTTIREIVREKVTLSHVQCDMLNCAQVYRRLHQELPYNTNVRVIQIKTSRSGRVHAHVEIGVSNKRQMKMVIGHEGSVVNALNETATCVYGTEGLD